MPINTDEPQPDLKDIQDREKYLLKSRNDVVKTLIELSKKPDLITASYNQGRDSIITTVVDVLQDRDLVIIEYGPDSDKNRKLLAAGSTTCLSKHNDIDIRFQLSGLRSAQYHGQHVFAAPIPETLMRLQRREFFRVHVPLENPLTCRIVHEKLGELELPLADISVGGLCLLDAEHYLANEKRERLEKCTLLFPNNGGELEVELEVRGIFVYDKKKGKKVQRLGCVFIDLSPEQSRFIQRYITLLQIQEKSLKLV
jgi:c-di-GMP-binding flagellar brake protein YcgR